MVGKLYSIQGKNGFYNLIICTLGTDVDLQLMTLTLTQIRTNGTIYPVENGFFFTTEDPVTGFWVGQDFYHVE